MTGKGLFGILELDEKEIKKLRLSKMIEVEWWGPDLVMVNARKSFYYIPGKKEEGKSISNPLDLVQVYPACLITKEEDEVNGKSKNSVRIKGLPNNSLRALNASHYYIGPSYGQEFNWKTLVGEFCDTRGKVTQIAPITFFRIK
ncbi:MAG: hypothetical protein ABIH28_01190 [archaeon]